MTPAWAWLKGPGFSSLCYALAGLPLALALDRGRRVGIAAGCMAVWSLATGASGLAVAFVPFLAARAVTAFAEAGFSPAVLSMIADRFPRRRIPAATAIYLIAPPVGTAAALSIGGALLQVFGKRGGLTLPLVGHLESWQAVFVTLMTPGLALAAVFALVIREPVRRDVRRHQGDAAPSTLKAELGADGGLLLIYMTAIALVMMSTFALSAWAPTLFIRRFDLPMHQAGSTLGPIFLVASLAGAVISSLLSRRADDEAILARVLAIILISASLLAPCIIGMCLSSSYRVALVFYGLSGLTAGVATSLATTPMQLSTSHAGPRPNHRGRRLPAGGNRRGEADRSLSASSPTICSETPARWARLWP